MAYDIFTMAAIRDELSDVAAGARIEKVIQPSKLTIALKLWSPGVSGFIVLSADASRARVLLTRQKLAKGFETPSSFVMLLRKYCQGGRVTAVGQQHLERVLWIDVQGREHGEVRIVAEVMGNRSNVILVSPEGDILGAVKLVGPRQSRTRQILPHSSYMLPPPQGRSPRFALPGEKLDPLAETLRNWADLGQIIDSADESLDLHGGLLGLFRGCSPLAASDIARRLGLPASVPIRQVDGQALARATDEQYRLLETRRWTPIVFRNDLGSDFRAYENPAVEGSERSSSMSEAIESVIQGAESVDALLAQRSRVKGLISRKQRELEGKLASLETGLARASNPNELKDAGNYILAYQHLLASGDDLLKVPDTDVHVPLDPHVRPIENAERYFKRYRKARDAAKRVPALIDEAARELALVLEMEAYADLAESISDIKRAETEFLEHFKPGGGRSKARTEGPGKVLTVRLPGGDRILVGRSARQNEELTFKTASRGDTWLHALGVPGAHVVLQSTLTRSQDDFPTESVKAAASLAAYYSGGRREGAVDVTVARVADVQRLPGGGPGQVRVRNGRTVRVPPKAAGELEAETGAAPED